MSRSFDLHRGIALTLLCLGLIGAGCGAEQPAAPTPEPGKMEPGKMEPGKMEPTPPESGKMEPGKME